MYFNFELFHWSFIFLGQNTKNQYMSICKPRLDQLLRIHRSLKGLQRCRSIKSKIHRNSGQRMNNVSFLWSSSTQKTQNFGRKETLTCHLYGLYTIPGNMSTTRYINISFIFFHEKLWRVASHGSFWAVGHFFHISWLITWELMSYNKNKNKKVLSFSKSLAQFVSFFCV